MTKIKLGERFTTQAGQADISQCIRCEHNLGGGLCEAYPAGIPDEILTNEHDHREPLAGDNGIRFEPIE